MLPISAHSTSAMIRRSDRLAAKRAPKPPGPDRLSVLPQELFLRICDYLVDSENELQVRFGLTSLFGHIRPIGLAKGLRALHCASKLLHHKTSAPICKLGFLMTTSGLKGLLRMAGDPQVTPHVTHVKLLFPTNMWMFHKKTNASCKEVAGILTDCLIRLGNLRKIELSGIKAEFRYHPRTAYVTDILDHYSLSVGSLLCALHASNARITDLIFDEGAEPMILFYRPYPGPLPLTWLSGLGNIERLRVVEPEDIWMHDNKYTKQILGAIPNLKELAITHITPAISSPDDWRDQCSYAGWIKAVLHSRYDWHLTAFHASTFTVVGVNPLKHFLHTHSPTLRDLAITEVIVSDSNHHPQLNLVVKSFWTEIFQIILDNMNLRKGKFHDLLYWNSGGSDHYVSVAMYWDRNNNPELDLYGRRFEEIAKVRGVTRALADWRDGMIMVEVE